MVLFTPEQIRAALVRSRAKKFANHLRSERWAESIPEEDFSWLESSEEIEDYKAILIQRGCRMRTSDFKWEAM